MKPTITLVLTSIYLLLTAQMESTPLDPSDPVTASFVREFERAASKPQRPDRVADAGHDQLSALFRAALASDGVEAQVVVARAQ